MSIQKQQLQGSFVKASECFVKPTMDLVLAVSKSQKLHETSKGLYTYPSSPLIDYEAITPCSWPQFPHLKIRKLTYWVISKVLSIPDLLWPWDIRCLFSAAISSNGAKNLSSQTQQGFKSCQGASSYKHWGKYTSSLFPVSSSVGGLRW